jgi:hypothetical protein
VEPVSLVVAALLAGSAAGVTSASSSMVTDAYAALKGLVRRRVAARRAGAEAIVDREQQDPAAWEAELVPVLTEAQVDQDEQIVTAARQLLALVDPSGAAAGKYTVDLREAKGVQVGDHNVQHNQFS